MKIELVPLLALTLAVGACAGPSTPELLTVAVFDFESRDDNVRDIGAKLAALVSAKLSSEPQIMTVERAELAKLLGEQELGLSGNVTGDTAAKVGQLTGAKVLVTGRVFKTEDETIAVAKIIGTETSRVYGEMVGGPGKASITELSEKLASKIMTVVTGKWDTLVAKVETGEQRIERMKKALKGEKRPLLLVRIAERHAGGPTIDPAAETELGKIAGECGFRLVDEKSDTKPDIEITGEALSEFGLRKGNLVSCKARVEIKARERTSGNILLVDRQTTVAVDISEQIAGKSALQAAAMELAERIIPRLAQ
jgi:hypothetical protein